MTEVPDGAVNQFVQYCFDIFFCITIFYRLAEHIKYIHMPGAYPRLSTIALTNATLSYALKFAGSSLDALRADQAFARGVNTHDGYITCRDVAESLELMERFIEFAG